MGQSEARNILPNHITLKKIFYPIKPGESLYKCNLRKFEIATRASLELAESCGDGGDDDAVSSAHDLLHGRLLARINVVLCVFVRNVEQKLSIHQRPACLHPC